VAARRARSAHPRGLHVLRGSALADSLVRGGAVRPGELVLDLGAGPGALTAALVRAGARVLAVERDPELARALRRRLPQVEVVTGDATVAPLPGEPFSVVSNLPFGSSTAILRRLLDPAAPLRRAELVVQWGLAVKRAAVWPSTLLSSYWGAWHELVVVRRLAPSAFAPPPAVDAAVLRVLRRREPLVAPADAERYHGFLHDAYTGRTRVSQLLPRRALRHVALEHGFDRRARATDLDAAAWAAVFHAVRRTGYCLARHEPL
jgi:16S rRNA A1518/A1519 N6-dimethyltransferase RsmA/KsgA/DIM1 with predicted DNA glycosylase/AP lyase activity